MLVDHANLVELFTGYKAAYQRGLGVATPMWDQIAMKQPSTSEVERYDWLGTMPGMREWFDDRAILSIGSHGFSIRNRSWEQTIGVEREKIEDDLHGIYTPLAQRMGEATTLHLDELVYDLLDAGRTTLGYDGVEFFDASHPNNADIGGTQSNVNTGSGPYWYLADLSSGIKPIILQMRKEAEFVSKTALTDDNVFFSKQFLMGVDARYNVGFGPWQQMYACGDALNEANLESALIAMSEITGPNGKQLSIHATHLIVPTTLQYTAMRLLNSNVLLGEGPSGEDGPRDNILKGSVQLIVSKHLARS